MMLAACMLPPPTLDLAPTGARSLGVCVCVSPLHAPPTCVTTTVTATCTVTKPGCERDHASSLLDTQLSRSAVVVVVSTIAFRLVLLTAGTQ